MGESEAAVRRPSPETGVGQWRRAASRIQLLSQIPHGGRLGLFLQQPPHSVGTGHLEHPLMLSVGQIFPSSCYSGDPPTLRLLEAAKLGAGVTGVCMHAPENAGLYPHTPLVWGTTAPETVSRTSLAKLLKL